MESRFQHILLRTLQLTLAMLMLSSPLAIAATNPDELELEPLVVREPERREVDVDEGGKVDFGSFFSGEDLGFFGGVEWQTPVEHLMLKAEFSSIPHEPGVVSMARGGHPDSASCQFFICLGDAAFLDGQYSAFGKIADDASIATLQKIGKLPTSDPGSGEKSKPVETVTIDKMTVTEV